MLLRSLARLAFGALIAVAPGLLLAQEEDGPRELPASAPAALREHYFLAEKSTSPDGRYAIISPNRRHGGGRGRNKGHDHNEDEEGAVRPTRSERV